MQPSVNACDKSPYVPNEIRLSQRRDPQLLQLILFLEKTEPYTMEVHASLSEEKASEFFLDENDILYKIQEPSKHYDSEKLLVVPESLRKEILLQTHDGPLGGHFGFKKTFEKIKIHYWWPLMYTQIQDWCATCDSCLRRKRPFGQKKAPLQPIPIGMPFERVAMDILGPLPETESHNKYVLVFSDYRSKWPEAACLPSIEAPRVAQALFDLIITRHGAPTTLLSDRGTNFLSKLMHEVYVMMNIKKLNTSSYRPQTDGLVEKFNSSLTQSLTMFCNERQSDWDLFVQGILFAYRTSVSSSTNETPFFLLYGRRARLPLDVKLLPPSKVSADHSEYRSILVKNLAIAQSLATKENEKSQERMKK